MRAVLQRVSRAKVTVEGETIGEVGPGLLVLLGVGANRYAGQREVARRKIVGLRIFNDDDGKMNRDVVEVGGSILIVSQFTLYGDARKGRRPSFISAAPSAIAIPLYEQFINGIKSLGVPTATGKFGADMKVELVNDGPVTLIIDTP
ncbi:MAG: D-aminoacyl-tRNA deacylase [Gemmataceae bacterium]